MRRTLVQSALYASLQKLFFHKTKQTINDQQLIGIEKQEVKEVYNNWRQALITNDVNFLEQLFSNDFISISIKGKSKNKQQELLWLSSGNLQYLYWEDKKISINDEGNNVLIKSSQTLQVLVYDLPTRIDREIILTFVKQDSKWQLKQYHEIA